MKAVWGCSKEFDLAKCKLALNRQNTLQQAPIISYQPTTSKDKTQIVNVN